MVSFWMRASLVSGCLVLSCAHAPPAAKKPATAVAAPPPSNPFDVTVDFKPDQTAVPPGMWFRIKSPNLIVPRIVEMMGDPTLRGFSDLRAFVGLAIGSELTSLIDFDAPFSFVAPREPDETNRSVVGVAHLTDEAHFAPEKLGVKLDALGPGRWHIQARGAGKDVRCELWHVAAPVGYRIVCGFEGADLVSRAPFLLGQLEKTPLKADAIAVSTNYPLGPSLAYRQRPPEKDHDANAEAADSPEHELLGELAKAESIEFELTFFEHDAELAVQLNYTESDTSPTVRAWLGKPPAPFPPQFWQTLDLFPIAVGNTGTDEATTKEFLSLPAVAGFLESLNIVGGVSPELAAEMLAASGQFIPERLRFTMGVAGPMPYLTRKARARVSGNRKAAKAAQRYSMLMGYAGSGENYLKGMDVLVQASKNKPAAGSKEPPAARWFRINTVPRDLPGESALFREECPDKSAWYTWVLPTADWVWVMSATNELDLLGQVRRALPSLQQTANPSERAAAALGADTPLIGMALSLAAVETTYGWLSDYDVATLPFGGSSRVFVSVSGRSTQVAGKPGVAARIASRWSPAATADLAELIKRAVSQPETRESAK